MEMFCPRCKKETEFAEMDDGPDTYEDDISYTSYNCNVCEIHCDGWNDNWYDGDEVTCWANVEGAEVLFSNEEYEKLKQQYEKTHS